MPEAIDSKWFEEMEARIPHGKVRTRFAPSPTGYMHVGNLRTALYTWLIARHADGTFILRIEDTDQGRLVEGAVDVIYKTLSECGLTHDEGPDLGGPVGPYIQTERRRDRIARMSGDKRIVLALRGIREGRQTFELPIGMKAVATTGENLMRVSLMTYVPN